MALIKEAEAGNKKEAGVILKYMNAMMRNNRNYLAVFTGATGCLCENTIIKGQTKTLGELYLKGERFIDTISFSHNPTKSQSEIIDSGKKELYEIELDEGKNVKATKEHKFFLKENFKFKEEIVGNLKVGDCLRIFPDNHSKIKSIKKIGIKQTYDLHTPTHHNFFLENGVLSHNSGKSYSCLRLSELWYKYYFKGREFPKENICFSVSDLVDRLDSGELKKGDVLIAEEIGVGANAKNFQSQTNKALQFILQSFRSLNIIVFFNVPHFSFFDKTARMLMHSLFQTLRIDKANNVCILKPYFLSISQHTGKIYPKWLRVANKRGGVSKINRLDLHKPSEEIIKVYEGMKERFVKCLINEMKVSMASKQEKERSLRELTDRQEDVFQLLLKGLKTGEIAEKLGRSSQDVSQAKRSIKKKGYIWNVEAKAEKLKEIKEMEDFL